MQTNANWRLVEGTANSSLGSPYYHPRSQSLDTLSPASPTGVVHLLFTFTPLLRRPALLKSLSNPLLCVSPPSPFRLSLRYLYIGCPNFPPCRDRAFNPFLALRSQQSSRERSRLSQMKSRVKHVIKNAEWYSFLRQALRRQVRHIPRSFVVRKQSAWLSSWRSLRTSLNGGRRRGQRRKGQRFAPCPRRSTLEREFRDGDGNGVRSGDDDGGRMRATISATMRAEFGVLTKVVRGVVWLKRVCVCVFFFSVETRYEFSTWRLSGNSYRDVPWEFYDVCHEVYWMARLLIIDWFLR